jgi:hypothetical protein
VVIADHCGWRPVAYAIVTSFDATPSEEAVVTLAEGQKLAQRVLDRALAPLIVRLDASDELAGMFANMLG